jgi:RasGEF domain
VADSLRRAVSKARLRNELVSQPELKAHDTLLLVGSLRNPTFPPERALFSYANEEIARQICLVDSQLFSAVNAAEFFHCAWNNKVGSPPRRGETEKLTEKLRD